MRLQRYFFYILLVSCCYSCSTAKYLQDDETWLRKNTIKFEESKSARDIAYLRYELEGLYEQIPNSRYFLVPSRYYYYRNIQEDDTLWYNRWIQKNVAEEPAIYQTQLTEQTRDNIQKFLVNKKGFYKASVDTTTQTLGNDTYVNYVVDLGERYVTKSMLYYGDDNAVISLLVENKEDTYIKPGVPIDALTFDLEKQRIISLLQNSGYADFNANYIDIKGDSTVVKNEVEIFIEIKTPLDTDRHTKYNIGSINVYTDHTELSTTIKGSSATKELDGVRYHRNSDSYIVKPNVLHKKVLFRSGTFYNKEEYYRTIQNLGDLSAYKFVRIEPKINDSLDHVIDYNIFLTPETHKWVSDIGNDVFYSTVNSISRRQVGFSLGGSLLNRNAFGGSEAYTLNAEAGVEFNIDQGIQTNTLSFSLQNNLEIPRYVDILGTFKGLNIFGLVDDDTYASIRNKAKTEIGVGGSFQRIIDLFDVTSLSASYGFDFNSSKRRIRFRQFGVGLFLYDIKPPFRVVLQDKPLIEKSLESNLFTGILFNEFAVITQTPKNRKGVSTSLLASLETSGLEVALVNSILSRTPWQVTDSIDFANFLKFSLDGRYYREFNKRNSVAMRGFFGIALPYYNDPAVPFVKQFYVGGPNGIRAWQARELGPGAYIETTPVDNGLFYQSGDLKLEVNLEYRTDLFYVFEGALFIDAGNVWTLSSDSGRPGSRFSSDFINQIAVGAGYGIRIDFNYFNIRFDFGYKILNPYKDDDGSRLMIGKKQGVLGNVNVAINYPF